MTTTFVKKLGFAAAAVSLLFGAIVPSAFGSFILTLDDTSTVGIDQIIIDDSPVGTLSSGGSFTSTTADAFSGLGTVLFAGSVGAFIVNVSTGASKPLIGPHRIDLNSMNISVMGAGNLLVGLTDTDFGPIGNASYVLEFGGTTDGTVIATASVAESNAEFGIGSGGVISTGPLGSGPFASTIDGIVGPSANFSMFAEVNISHAEEEQVTSFNVAVRVPEPTTVGLLGIGLLVFSWVGRKSNAPQLHK